MFWSHLPARLAVPLTAIAACATILAKPSGLLALVGLAAAAWVLSGRASVPGICGLGLGAAVGIAYDAWQASRLDVSLTALLRAGNDDFWLARGDAARLDALAGAAWLGQGARLLLVLGLAYGIARAVGGGARLSLRVSTALALVWSVGGPLLADGSLGYPFDGSVLGVVGLAGDRRCARRSVLRRRGRRGVASHVRRASRLARTGGDPAGLGSGPTRPACWRLPGLRSRSSPPLR